MFSVAGAVPPLKLACSERHSGRDRNKVELYLIRALLISAFCLLTSDLPLQASTPGPITSCQILDTAGAYTLQNDVSSAGTCFSIQADHITLDLSGHTVTYGTGPVITVPNGSFETGDTTGWDFSQAPAAQVKAGTFIPPTLWEGNYSVAIRVPSVPQTIKSSPVLLPGGRTYVVSAMFYNLADDNISNSIEVDDANTGAVLSSQTKTGRTWRGFQLTYPASIVVNSDTTVVLKLSVGGTLAASGTVYWDDARIQIGPAHGVAARACWNTEETLWNAPVYYDDPCGGFANNLVVKNGSLVQGAGRGFAGHAIGLHQINGSDNDEFANLHVATWGPKSQGIHSDYHLGLNIHDNVFISSVTTIEGRDYFEGAYIQSGLDPTDVGNTIVHHNTFSGGPQGAIVVTGIGGQIDANDISSNARYTNDFQIVDSGTGMQIFNNTIHPVSGKRDPPRRRQQRRFQQHGHRQRTAPKPGIQRLPSRRRLRLPVPGALLQ